MSRARPEVGPADADATTDATTALTFESVTRRFGHTVAVDGVSLAVAPEELIALVGPSGCGKSTLLRLAAGLLEADAGRILLGGAVVDDGRTTVPPEGRHVGLVFQEHALFPHLTVAKNLAFGLRRLDRDATRQRVAEVLELVGLSAMADRYPHELSGGERQRVALARAMAPRPTLLLLDEPFASLDPNLRSELRRDVVGILRDTSTPAVFVTHDQVEALAVGDRIAVMRAGRIRQLASPWEVFHRPAERFVAAFMGEASFLPVVHDAGDRCELGPVADGAVPAAGAATAMVRPDDVALRADGGGGAEVVAAEFRGSWWCYEVRLASGAPVLAGGSHLDQLAVGDRVEASLVPGHTPVAVPET